MGELFQRSIQIILANQVSSGAYPAGPNFPTYRYSWFRDGAFIAYAISLAGQHDSARRFHDWAARTVLGHADKAERAIEKARRGEPLGEDYLHTRYTLDGGTGTEEWPNFQLDGLGTWLWAFAEHVRCTSEPPSLEWETAAGLVARYLTTLWFLPCYDLWEEHSQYRHPYTLAAIYAGLQAVERLATADHRPQTVDSLPLSDVTDQIRRFVLEHGVQNEHLVKHITLAPVHPRSSAQVDASLIGVATPYRLLTPDDPLMQATVARIESNLHCPGGGVHRYLADTYYGGGEWVLLAAWLGWYYTEVEAWGQAAELLHWIEAQVDAAGHLPEQVSTHLLAPDRYAEWEARWGPIAKPLLWSHAMYLILYHALESAERG